MFKIVTVNGLDVANILNSRHTFGKSCVKQAKNMRIVAFSSAKKKERTSLVWATENPNLYPKSAQKYCDLCFFKLKLSR